MTDKETLAHQLGAFVNEYETQPEPEDAAFAPLDEAYREQLTDTLLAHLEGASDGPVSGAVPRVVAAAAVEERAQAPKVVSISERRRSWNAVPAMAMGGLAIAAAVALYVSSGEDAIAPLPEYSLSVRGAVSERRGEAPAAVDSVVKLLPTSDFEVLLRPEAALEGPLHVKASIDGAAVPLEFERADSGSVRLHGSAELLFGARRGAFELEILLQRPGADVPAAGPALQGSGFQRFVVPIEVSDTPP
jgi:hypothetical protein